jgi:hypothetical protein
VRSCALLFVVGCGFSAAPINAAIDAPDNMGSEHDAAGPDWRFKRQLTIDNTTLGPLTEFPLLVVLTPARIRYSAAGADLRFSDATGMPLYYEIESWDPTGTSAVWVRVPAIADHATTTLWMYYDNPDVIDAQLPAAVWDASYVGVWHLVDAHDSTGRNASVNTGATPTPGRIGPALQFSASKYIDTMSAAFLTRWTIEAWIDPATASQQLSPGGTSVIARLPNYLMLWDCNSLTFCHTVLFNDSIPQTHATSYGATVGAWTHVAGTYDGTGVLTYSNGVVTGPAATMATPANTTDTAKIGVRNDLVGPFPGAIDEVRISNVARSADYMKATTRAGLDTYVMFGPELPNQ